MRVSEMGEKKPILSGISLLLGVILFFSKQIGKFLQIEWISPYSFIIVNIIIIGIDIVGILRKEDFTWAIMGIGVCTANIAFSITFPSPLPW